MTVNRTRINNYFGRNVENLDCKTFLFKKKIVLITELFF